MMIEKIKKKIGFALRLYGYQIAMSIYTLMITIPIRALSDSFTVKLIAVLFSVALYLVIIYFAAHDLGEKDFVGRNNPINPPRMTDGFIFAVMGQIINIVLIIMLFIPIDSVKFISQIIFNFTDYMYIPKSYIANGISGILLPIWYIAAAIPMIIVTGIGYLFGFKGIKIARFFKFDKKEIYSSPNEDNPDFDK